jgi:carboxyl-terminal processing protease
LVVETIKGSPASFSGVLPKDVIVKIDNLSTNDMSIEQVVKLIRGSVGTQVRLGILRQGKPLNFTLKRERFVVQSR